MHRLPDNGIIYVPYGGIGFVQRITPKRTAVRFSVMRWFLKLFA
jgi:hypothetical protein